MNTLIKSAGKVVATVSASHNVTVTEKMITIEDAPYTYEYPNHYKILPSINDWNKDPERIGEGIKVDTDFTYCSDSNSDWMEIETLQSWIDENLNNIGKI